ncbi:N-methylhydantoinase B [Acetobacter tropicalis NRIC 0312]|uniref:Methylhydantoinase n=1 Tax=Acetobacter tropicalis TaxID=104102 RepID=A0A511FL89_9PROT|nr:hydantoinase B/oxoprolinase family protein [Acetobacter tropicalis]KXV48102.1 methylhydantoinase [Acetobacter tropicalis]GAL97566.1 methylhydantoinase [Acetobacter tropicalis]GBR67392.1 N-methylhydantoinase B [Acetobacter tropicalis NRIC 0312]GEL49985.1 methylhydantoinase [Acetobacter tropicalis]
MNDSTGQASHDPITLEIIQNSLQAVADEMFATMRKTAMSSIIYEVLDMGTGILDARGRIASSGAGIPSFVGVLDKAVQVLLAKFPQETIRPGDVFITNDPYYGGVTHLNDLVVAMPVFAEGCLIAWTANIAHNSDVGGMAPGSLSVQATEIFQEGLRLPAIRLIDAGEANESVFAILRCNSRMPNFLEGDLWAAIAAVRIGARRLTELATKYGIETFETAMEGFMTFGEKVTLSTLATLPHGTFELDEEQDDGRVYNVKVTISPNEFVVDLRNNPDQDVGPTNTSRDGAMICAQMMLKALCAPQSPANDGTFRPIRLLTREGSVFHAREPAAIGFYFETEVRVFDLIWRCLAQHMPQRLGAGHFATIGGTFIGGIHPDTGRQYTIIEPQIGGWGGREGHDGNSALFSGFHGETYNCPAEISEARNGLHIGRMALHTGPGGEGQWCGGRGIVIDYGVRQDNSFLTIGYTRSRIMPWSLKEGHEGTGNYALILRCDGTQERHAFISGLRVDKGDVIRIVTGTGGGYGNPALRDRALVARDVKNGLITAEHAQRIYTT